MIKNTQTIKKIIYLTKKILMLTSITLVENSSLLKNNEPVSIKSLSKIKLYEIFKNKIVAEFFHYTCCIYKLYLINLNCMNCDKWHDFITVKYF